jgi:hypothetical protein
MTEEKELAIIGVCVLAVCIAAWAGIFALCIHAAKNMPFTGLY